MICQDFRVYFNTRMSSSKISHIKTEWIEQLKSLDLLLKIGVGHFHNFPSYCDIEVKRYAADQTINVTPGLYLLNDCIATDYITLPFISREERLRCSTCIKTNDWDLG